MRQPIIALALISLAVTASGQSEGAFLTNIRQLTFEGKRAGEGYFSQDGTLWHGQLAPFMTQNASMSLEDIQQALFHNPGLFRPLSADALQAWKRLTDF